MWTQRYIVCLRIGRHLDELCNAAQAPRVRIQELGTALVNEIPKTVQCIFVFSHSHGDPASLGKGPHSLIVILKYRLLKPVWVILLDHPAEFQRLMCFISAVSVHHEPHIFAHSFSDSLYASHVLLHAQGADFHLYTFHAPADIFLHLFLELQNSFPCRIVTARDVARHFVGISAQQLIQRHS